MGLEIGKATLTRKKRFCSSDRRRRSTSSTTPILFPISIATFKAIISNDTSHIWIHIDACSKTTFLELIPAFHRISIKSWLSKLHGPPRRMRSRSYSDWNLNWKRLEPTLDICNSLSEPHAFWRVFFVAFRLYGLQVRNFPIKLNTQLSISSDLPSSETWISSSSLNVNFRFTILLITSSAIVSFYQNWRKPTARDTKTSLCDKK